MNTTLTDSVTVVPTPTTRAVADSVNFAVATGSCVLVHGGHGTGKATAVRRALYSRRLDAVWIDVAARPTGRELLRMLHTDVVAPEQWSERDRQDDVAAALATTRRPVVVRHADRLTAEAMGQLHWLHGRPDAQWPLILTGGPKALATMRRDPLISNSIANCVAVSQLKADDMVAAASGMHPLFMNAPNPLLYTVDKAVGHGVIGRWSMFLRHALYQRSHLIEQGYDIPLALSRALAAVALEAMPQLKSGR
jgi:hypothetical protein